MTDPTVAPYGSWASPITTDLIVQDSVILEFVRLYGADTYWTERRPSEGGRQVVVRRTPDGRRSDLVPPPFNARTRVHEYGGLPYAVDQDGNLYFTNFADQRIYRVEPGGEPQPFSPEPPQPGDLRYADQQIDNRRRRLISVLEDHRGQGEAANSLVSLNLDNGAEMFSLAEGANFYASPSLSPDGKRLAWLSWNHPNMPWDGTQLWLGDLDEAGHVVNQQQVAGGPRESIFQPQWSPEGSLYYVSDRTGWWNLYRWNQDREEPLYPLQADFGEPQWVFGKSMYGFAENGDLILTFIQLAEYHLARLNREKRQLIPIETPYTRIQYLRVADGRAVMIAGSPTQSDELVELDLESMQFRSLRESSPVEVDPGYLSLPETIAFPTENNQTAYGFFYPPANKDFRAPTGELPPLIVFTHGGPTSSAITVLSLEKQFWTSRGLAVLDVNYGGSTGYGRLYRQRLYGQWGLMDVDDAMNGARYLAERGLVDPQRMAIRGRSAGGYTTLSALTFRDFFQAGASHFGLGDLETFVRDTHKFESRYLEQLVGPYPEQKELYYQRSPIHFVEQLNTPIILFQGLEDKIVPPDQAETMFEAVKAKGLPVAYLPFEGEQHGFRQAQNIRRALEAELYFYGKIFGFKPADEIEPVEIENLPDRSAEGSR